MDATAVRDEKNRSKTFFLGEMAKEGTFQIAGLNKRVRHTLSIYT
jgi:preprotein translocase subunit SecB